MFSDVLTGQGLKLIWSQNARLDRDHFGKRRSMDVAQVFLFSLCPPFFICCLLLLLGVLLFSLISINNSCSCSYNSSIVSLSKWRTVVLHGHMNCSQNTDV